MKNPEILQHFIKSETDDHCIIEWDDVLKAMEVARLQGEIDRIEKLQNYTFSNAIPLSKVEMLRKIENLFSA